LACMAGMPSSRPLSRITMACSAFLQESGNMRELKSTSDMRKASSKVVGSIARVSRVASAVISSLLLEAGEQQVLAGGFHEAHRGLLGADSLDARAARAVDAQLVAVGHRREQQVVHLVLPALVGSQELADPIQLADQLRLLGTGLPCAGAA